MRRGVLRQWCREAWEFCDDGSGNTTLMAKGSVAHHLVGMRRIGDEIVSDGETCDAGAANSDGYGLTAGCNTSCSGVPPYCGDGIQSGEEVCDAGPLNSNAWSPDGSCNTTCTGYSGSCGDGIVQLEETWTTGKTIPTLPAERVCNGCDGYAPYCGDEIVSDGEACDEGASNSDAYSFGGLAPPAVQPAILWRWCVEANLRPATMASRQCIPLVEVCNAPVRDPHRVALQLT